MGIFTSSLFRNQLAAGILGGVLVVTFLLAWAGSGVAVGVGGAWVGVVEGAAVGPGWVAVAEGAALGVARAAMVAATAWATSSCWPG